MVALVVVVRSISLRMFRKLDLPYSRPQRYSFRRPRDQKKRRLWKREWTFPGRGHDYWCWEKERGLWEEIAQNEKCPSSWFMGKFDREYVAKFLPCLTILSKLLDIRQIDFFMAKLNLETKLGLPLYSDLMMEIKYTKSILAQWNTKTVNVLT